MQKFAFWIIRFNQEKHENAFNHFISAYEVAEFRKIMALMLSKYVQQMIQE